jgi:hypothetical protein
MGWLMVSVGLLTVATQCQAGWLSLESAGLRGGFSGFGEGARFHQAEAFVEWNLPLRWDWTSGWHLQSRFDFTAGWISGRGEQAAIGTLGPSLELSWDRVPLTLDAGSSPTLMSKEQFGKTDFGTVFQFTTHIGLTWKIGSHLDLGYRFQHMSNAGIGPSNPGLNLHLFGAGWRF